MGTKTKQHALRFNNAFERSELWSDLAANLSRALQSAGQEPTSAAFIQRR